MAKRRSLNRKWSRRSGNSSAVLNDDTNVFEEDSNIWQYLNETNSRPPSILNMTEATAILGSDSNLVDSRASSSILNYLPKSPEEQRPKAPKNGKSSRESDDKNQEEPGEPTDSDESTKIKKKRVILGKTRGIKKVKNRFSMNSSSSTVDGEPLPRSSQKIKEKSESQVPVVSPDSDTSLESAKIMKKRPKFKRPASTLGGKSLLASGDDSIIAPSQETRKTSIKPRKTFATGASINVTGEGSESEPEPLISQKRRMFQSTRRSRKSVNPFTSILEDIDAADMNEEVEQPKSRDNSNDFVLQVDSLNSEEQKLSDSKSKKRRISDVSGSSISEELKVRENLSGRREERIERLQSAASEEAADDKEDDDSDEYESLEEEEAGVKNSADVPDRKSGNENRQNLSVDGGRLNESRNTRRIVSPHLAEAMIDGKGAPDVSVETDDEEIFDSGNRKSLTTSKAAEHQSPIISGSMLEASQESENSDGESNKPAPQNKVVTRSSLATVKTTLKYAKGEGEQDSSDLEEESLFNRSKKLTQSLKLRSPQVLSEENREGDGSEEELDVETVSDDEPIFAKVSATNQSQSADDNEVVPVKSRNKKTPTAEEIDEPLNTSRPGPRSSKTPKKSRIPPKPKTPAPELEKSPDSTVERDSPLQASPVPRSRSSKTVKSPENQLSHAPKEVLNESTKRPGPKSFKKSLSTSRHSEKSKTSARLVQYQTESLSESSSRKRAVSRRDPSLYELPPKERSPSPSLSESEQELISRRHKQPIGKALDRSKSRRIEPESEDEEQVAKRLTSPRRSSAAPSQHLMPQVQIEMGDDSETPPTAPLNKLINGNQKSRSEVDRDKENVSMNDPTPSTSYKAPMDVGTGGERRKLKQLKLDAMRPQARRGLRRSLSNSDESFDQEEFDKKIREIRRKELMKRAENEETEKAATKKRLENMKREEEAKNKKARDQLKAAFKRIDEEYRPMKKKPKTVHPAYMVNGKVYKRPKLPRPKHWATNKLYNFLWKKMEPKFGVETRVRSEQFVLDLAESVTVIMRRKKYENYKGEIDALLKKMAKLGIIKNRFDFNGFCYDFLPYEFRIKVVSMLQFGNTHNIPFEPDKLMVPIIGDDEED